MNTKNYFLHVIVLLVFNFSFLFAQDNDYAKQELQMDNIVYYSTIKTVQCYHEKSETSFPAIELGKGERIILAFDDLEAGVKSLQYTFIHCDFNWNPSSLMTLDYLYGSPEDNITNWQASSNTMPVYTHFKLSFPNNNLQVTKSGNYIIKVYQNNDPEQLILTRRFLVFEKKVGINANVHGATNNQDRSYKQEVDFEIGIGEFPLNEPYNNVLVSILQNQRFDNAITSLKPMYAKSNSLSYDYDEGNVFNGLSEFRELDIKNLLLTSLRVSNIRRDDDKYYHVFMNNEESNAFKRYSYNRDLNGQFVIKNALGLSDTDADYAYVHFTLPADKQYTGDVYVTGAFSAFKCLTQYKMIYDDTKKMYLLRAPFKQGYYNYHFRVKKAEVEDETAIEGNRFETENSYTILVYYRGIGFFYDKLIGISQVYSNSFSR